MSTVKGLIPDSVKQSWREWRGSMKQAEQDITGGDQISEHVEMAGWGVEEAEQANKKEASKFFPIKPRSSSAGKSLNNQVTACTV